MVYSTLMERILGVICSFGVVGLMLLADSLESLSVSYMGSLLWMIAIFLGALVIFWQAGRTKVSQVVLIVAFVPFLNLLLIPLVTIILGCLPAKAK